jgi:phage terminase large subunit-like protein
VINKDRALEPIEFISLLHLTGDFYGQPFVLQDWEHKILWDVYGTVDERGYRKYQYIYLEIPKKNGKTELTAAVSLYHGYCDPPGGQIYCCAAEREQAALVYRAAKQMIEQDEELQRVFNVVDSKKEIHNRETGTFIKVLSAEAYSKHGLNPTVVIFDELHAQRNRDLWDTMTFGAGAARKEPLWWVITTAGDDPDRKTIGWEIHEQAVKIRDGVLEDPTWYVKIYGAPEDADIYDEKVWYECNPSLGVSIDIEAVRKEAIKARNSESAERLFRWLRLNQWVSLKRIGWLPITLWDKTVGKWSAEELKGKRCYVGIDLASIIDLTAAVLLFPEQDGIDDWRFLINVWIPENNMKERIARDHVAYGEWVKKGLLEATPGDRVDYRLIKNRIEKIELLYDVQYYCGDPWQLEVLRQQLGDEIADKFIEIPQTYAGMSAGMRELERRFRGKEITHLENALGRWAFGNVIVSTDGNENIKPMKNRSLERIDPIVALINAASGAIRLEINENTAYDNHGIRMV